MSIPYRQDIAIISMQRTVNFGSVLQAWSLKCLIETASGNTPRFVDIDTSTACETVTPVDDAADYEATAAYPSGLLQKAKRFIIARLSGYTKRKIRRFMRTRLHLKAADNRRHYDWAVIGSDEVFNNKNGVCLQLHGAVQNADRVLTYAAACGNATADAVPPQARPLVATALKRCAAVSVRDTATAQYVQTLADVPTVRHLDPVLVGPLATRAPRAVKLQRYLLVYAYGQRIRTKEEINAIRAFATQKGLKTVAMGGSQFWCDLYIPASPMRLLDYFNGADYVVTDTFHGIVFSVINRKKFAVLPRQSNTQKVSGLLKDLSLTDRMVHTIDRLQDTLTAPIDYEQLDALLQCERQKTIEYLAGHVGGVL